MHKYLVVLLVFAAACQDSGVKPPTDFGPVPTPAQLAWHRMETNAFIHFSINTFTDLEWGMGSEKESLFNPTALDANQWVTVLKNAGFKGIILTTKHHDGFCLWPSQYTDHSVRNSPYLQGKGDVVKSLADATHAAGLQFGIYVSPWDRNHKDYGRPEYVTYYRNQLAELFQAYGPIFEMWFDGANGGDGYYGGANEKRSIKGSTYYEWPVTIEGVRKMNDQVIFFSDAGPSVRWVGNERGVAGETNWNTITVDTLFAGKPGIERLLNTGSEGGKQWIPAEVDVSIRPGWFYHAREDSLVKTPQQLFDIYLTSVGRGSVLLLNVPPDRRGLIHEHDAQVLQEWRKLLDDTFSHDFAKEANLIADHVRGNDPAYGAAMTTDGNADTYWATDDSVRTATLEFNFDEEKLMKYMVVQEAIAKGQRVKSWSVEILDGEWIPVANGTTIGYKRIIPVGNYRARQIRLVIQESLACPLISTVSLY